MSQEASPPDLSAETTPQATEANAQQDTNTAAPTLTPTLTTAAASARCSTKTAAELLTPRTHRSWSTEYNAADTMQALYDRGVDPQLVSEIRLKSHRIQLIGAIDSNNAPDPAAWWQQFQQKRAAAAPRGRPVAEMPAHWEERRTESGVRYWFDTVEGVTYIAMDTSRKEA